MTADPLLLIAPLLAQHLGLEVSSIGAASVLAAVATRARARGVSLEHYSVLPATDTTELTALIDEIVVPESWFFRDRVPFTHLAAHAADRLRTGKTRKFRVLSAPCATGEEPYTVVMAMLDAGVAPSEVEVLAVDVSMPLLAAAREACTDLSRSAARTSPTAIATSRPRRTASGSSPTSCDGACSFARPT